MEENELDGPLHLLERRLRVAPRYLVDPDACLPFRYGTPVVSFLFFLFLIKGLEERCTYILKQDSRLSGATQAA